MSAYWDLLYYGREKGKDEAETTDNATLTVETYSMVVLPDPGENWPSMKTPQGKLDFPW